jgi:hypothetical protein
VPPFGLHNPRWGVGSTHFPYTVRSASALKARFSATLEEEPEAEPVLV